MRLLDVLIAGYGSAGLRRVSASVLPEVPGVRYVVCLQNCDDAVPEILQREDVEIYRYEDSGLSLNRNHAIEKAAAPLALIADDDVDYSAAGLRELINFYASHPRAELVAVRCGGLGNRRYPEAGRVLQPRVRGYYPASVEISFRTEAVRGAGLRFDERFGLGAPEFTSGEDDVFVYKALRVCGLNGVYSGIETGTHRGQSTEQRRPDDKGVLRSRGAVLRMMHGVGGWPRMALYSLRCRGGRMRALREMIYGYRHMPR
ncbi:MAG: glycosyltransferase [Muribaculaceae bacterium]|nr:glycosyltransferase [Muribaculaceae bacterium]